MKSEDTSPLGLRLAGAPWFGEVGRHQGISGIYRTLHLGINGLKRSVKDLYGRKFLRDKVKLYREKLA